MIFRTYYSFESICLYVRKNCRQRSCDVRDWHLIIINMRAQHHRGPYLIHWWEFRRNCKLGIMKGYFKLLPVAMSVSECVGISYSCSGNLIQISTNWCVPRVQSNFVERIPHRAVTMWERFQKISDGKDTEETKLILKCWNVYFRSERKNLLKTASSMLKIDFPSNWPRQS